MRISTVINGWTVLVYAIPFDGHTGFADTNHARNFVRYLFSQSKAHQPSEDTALNFCIEQQDGLWLKGGLNTDPGGCWPASCLDASHRRTHTACG